MTVADLRFMQDCLKYLPDEETRDRANLIILNAAADGVKLKKLQDSPRGSHRPAKTTTAMWYFSPKRFWKCRHKSCSIFLPATGR